MIARVHPEAVNHLYIIGRFSRVERVDAPDEDGWAKVSICFQFEDDACECLLGFGDLVDILDPPELRDKLIDRAKSVIAFYANRS